jgi:hypothetical protein
MLVTDIHRIVSFLPSEAARESSLKEFVWL